MPSLPRILTVDPSDRVKQQVSIAIDLLDRSVKHMHVHTGADALEELKQTTYTAVISAWVPGGGMQGWELAAKIKQIAPDTPIIILGELGDMQLDEEMLSASPFIYLKRPFDMVQFIRVLSAAMDGEDVMAAFKTPAVATTTTEQRPKYAAPPNLNRDKAVERVHGFMTDIGANAVLLVSRSGEILIEHGVIGYIDKAEFVEHVLPSFVNGLELRHALAGEQTHLQLYDGSEYDVYVLSVGFHYFLMTVFDGDQGAKQLGIVTRMWRRCAEDLVGLLGADAWLLRPAEYEDAKPVTPRKSDIEVASAKQQQIARQTREETAVPSPLASAFAEPAKIDTSEVPEVPAMPQFEPIADLDFNTLFGSSAGGSGEAEMDDLFSLDNMEAIAKDDPFARRETISWDDAERLGVLKGGGSNQ